MNNKIIIGILSLLLIPSVMAGLGTTFEFVTTNGTVYLNTSILKGTAINCEDVIGGSLNACNGSGAIGNSTEDIWSVVDNGTFAYISGLSADDTNLSVSQTSTGATFGIGSGFLGWLNTLFLRLDGSTTMSGDLDIGGNNIVDLADVTFQNGANGGTLRTGTTSADKFQLQAYDNNNGSYSNMLELDAGNSPTIIFNQDRNNEVDVLFKTGASDSSLFVDGDSGNVGIGTTSPSDLLSVAGDVSFSEGDEYRSFYWDATNARLGVNNDNPQGVLSIDNTNAFSTDSVEDGEDNIWLYSTGATGGEGNYGASIGFGNLVTSLNARRAAIAAKQTGADSDEIGLAFFTHPSATAGDPIVEKMVLTSGGNVGIGTTDPKYSMTIGGGSPRLSFKDTGASNAYLIDASGSDANLAFRIDTSHSGTPNTNVMTLDSSGNVGIGTTDPTHELHVDGDANITGTVYYGALQAQSPTLYWTDDPFHVEIRKAKGGQYFLEYVDENLETVREWIDCQSREWYHVAACHKHRQKKEYELAVKEGKLYYNVTELRNVSVYDEELNRTVAVQEERTIQKRKTLNDFGR